MGDFWGNTTSRGGRATTSSRYAGPSTGYARPESADFEDIVGNAKKQEQALRNWAPAQPVPMNPQGIGDPAMTAKLRGLHQAKEYFDRLEGPDWYGTRTVRVQNPAFRNMMAAGAVAGIPFKSGWDVYTALAGAGANPSAQKAEATYALANAPYKFQAGG